MGTIKYYPTSRVLANQNTTGNMFTLNGEPYVGAYYVTYDGEAYTGANPASGGNELLTNIGENESDPETPTKNPLVRQQSRSTKTKDPLTIAKAYAPNKTVSQEELKQIVPYYRIATEADYKKGYFTRYFAKRINIEGYIIEISYENWATMTNDTDDSYEDYQVLDMLWQLTGPLHDTRVSQYQIIGGVYDTNKRVTEGKAKGFNGLVEYIGGDYTKFARITP